MAVPLHCTSLGICTVSQQIAKNCKSISCKSKSRISSKRKCIYVVIQYLALENCRKTNVFTVLAVFNRLSDTVCKMSVANTIQKVIIFVICCSLWSISSWAAYALNRNLSRFLHSAPSREIASRAIQRQLIETRILSNKVFFKIR